jgi:hypothetical protein
VIATMLPYIVKKSGALSATFSFVTVVVLAFECDVDATTGVFEEIMTE